jgi:hypothetical protein
MRVNDCTLPFVEIVVNFYVPDEGNKKRAIELWQHIKKINLKRGERPKE